MPPDSGDRCKAGLANRWPRPALPHGGLNPAHPVSPRFVVYAGLSVSSASLKPFLLEKAKEQKTCNNEDHYYYPVVDAQQRGEGDLPEVPPFEHRSL